MKNKWKFLFLTSIIILLISNIYWVYTSLDNAVGNSYYKVSCDEYLKDSENFKNLIDSKDTRAKLIAFLKNNKVEFDGFYKGENYVVNFYSFSVEYDKYGIKIK